MQDFFRNIVSDIGINDIIDVLIVAFVIYKLLLLIRDSRAEQLLKGVIVLVVATFVSAQINLYSLHWILNGTLTLGVVALVVVFQPELRRALEYVGRGRLFRGGKDNADKNAAKRTVSQLVRAIDNCSETKTGALIILERKTLLTYIAETATILDAEVSAELMGNIFYVGSPLHDGAAIIRQDRVFAAGCVLPLSSSREISKELGTRHRAGLGITEQSDAVAIIVSEETGIISIAKDGKLKRFLDVKSVEKELLSIYLDPNSLKERIAKNKKFLNRSSGDEKNIDENKKHASPNDVKVYERKKNSADSKTNEREGDDVKK